MKNIFALILITLTSSIFYSCTQQMEELKNERVYSSYTEMTVQNYSMYHELISSDVFFNHDCAMVIRDLFLFNESMKQEQIDYKHNKVKEVSLTLDYGEDSAKIEYAKMKINRNGLIEEYTPIFPKDYKCKLNFIYDNANRLIEITGTDAISKRTFSYYKFIYKDKQIAEIIMGAGSQFPKDYIFEYAGENNQLLIITTFNTYDRYYLQYYADFDKDNRLFEYSSKFLLGTYTVNHSEGNIGSSVIDTIKCTNKYRSEFFITKNNRIQMRAMVREAGGEKRISPREVSETIIYTYNENNLLNSIESDVRDFRKFYIRCAYEFYVD